MYIYKVISKDCIHSLFTVSFLFSSYLDKKKKKVSNVLYFSLHNTSLITLKALNSRKIQLNT